jgi:hypothetical protein
VTGRDHTHGSRKRAKSTIRRVHLISDIMAYFVGTPDGTGVGHDDEAKAIAANAYQFTQKRMRWVDMQSYTLLMALEVSVEGDGNPGPY